MKLPSSATAVVRIFKSLIPREPIVSAKKMLGPPAAFVEDKLVFGVFGDQILVRTPVNECLADLRLPGFLLFEQMRGIPMNEYVVLPSSVLVDTAEAQGWVKRSLAYVSKKPEMRGKRRLTRRAVEPSQASPRQLWLPSRKPGAQF